MFGLIDLGDAKDVVNVADHCQSLRWDKVCSSISKGRASDIGIDSLDLVRRVTGGQAIALDRNKNVKVALCCSVVWKGNVLSAPRTSRGSTSSRLSTRPLTCRWLDVDRGHCDIALLDHKYFGGQVAGLGLLTCRQLINTGTNEEFVGQIV